MDDQPRRYAEQLDSWPLMLPGFALAGVAVLLGAQAALESRLVVKAVPTAVPRSVVPLPPRLLQWVSFGQVPVAVDSLWLRALQLADLSATKRLASDERPQLYHDMDSLTELDPLYFQAYETGTILLTVASRDAEGALKLAEKGLRYKYAGLSAFPESIRFEYWSRAWNLHVLRAYLYMFERGDIPSASAEFLAAAKLPGAPRYLAAYEQRLLKPDGQYEVGLRLLNQLIRDNPDPATLERLEEQRRSLHVSQFVFNLNRDFHEFLIKIPEYRTNTSVPVGRLREFWVRYRDERLNSGRDPWGGELSLDSGAGRIVTTTEHERVLGLD